MSNLNVCTNDHSLGKNHRLKKGSMVRRWGEISVNPNDFILFYFILFYFIICLHVQAPDLSRCSARSRCRTLTMRGQTLSDCHLASSGGQRSFSCLIWT